MEPLQPDVEDWIEQWPKDQQDQIKWLAERVRAADSGITEAIKWRRLTFTVNGNWHHWLCATAVAKRGVSLMFHKGSLLDDRRRLLRGEGRYLRQVPFEAAVSDPGGITTLVAEAIKHQTEMLDGE